VTGKPMMQCGHAANATAQGGPCCAICAPDTAAYLPCDAPNLAGRQARCSYKCKVVPSSTALPFFEYLGPGSAAARERCKTCSYFEAAHRPGTLACDTFEPHGPYEYDRYYCGCRGWD
jgi:hypothetical protein